jgi:polyhydroxyalkanoate synthesis repressor PhaR
MNRKISQRSNGGPGERIVAVVIKKYANRRLYDTSAGRYVNLEDVAALIRKGEEVQVLDAKSGEDLTRVVLTQIIVEDAKGQPTGLPLELLRQLIVASDRAGQDFIMWYLKSAFDAYRNVQGTVQARLDDVRSAAMAPLSMVRNIFGGTPPPADETERLRRRVEELEALLAERGSPPGRRGKKQDSRG